MTPLCSIPGRFTLQWHINEACNLRCLHCYQEAVPRSEMTLERCSEVIEQFKQFLCARSKLLGKRVIGHINLTGGEPLLHTGFLSLLNRLSAESEVFSYALLTNGTLIDRAMARSIAHLNASFVQISLEGAKELHDRIRGPGTYNQSIAALNYLASAGVKALVSFTASMANYQEFPAVVRAARRAGAFRVWADRLIPLGRAGGWGGSLGAKETRELCLSMAREKKKRRFSRTEVSLGRALQFLVDDSRPYRCSAGRTLLALMPDGEIFPCRRLPHHAGNLFQSTLEQIYEREPFLIALRDPRLISKGCERCFYAKVCGGGLRCLAYAMHGDAFRADPGCWLATEEPIPDLVSLPVRRNAAG